MIKLGTILLTSAIVWNSQSVNAQSKISISTIDIVHFWEAYDSLPKCKDSVAVIQRLYINRASDGFKDFIKARNFTAGEYVKLIRRFPKFWNSIRPNTMAILQKQKEIEDTFNEFSNRYKGFKRPRVCFAIGCLRTGGTTSSNQILIGSEIASSTSANDKSEMRGWLQSVIGSSSGDVVAMVAHEAVHTQQASSVAYIFQYLRHRILAQSIREGAADFVSQEIANTNINGNVYAYGNGHLQELKEEFFHSMNGNDLSKWLYNGGSSNAERPADLGYFMGYKICEAYYNRATDKTKALRHLMQTKNPRKILKKSGFF